MLKCRTREETASDDCSSRRAELMRPSQQWIAPSSPSATQAAVSLAIRSRLICAARGHSPRSRRT